MPWASGWFDSAYSHHQIYIVFHKSSFVRCCTVPLTPMSSNASIERLDGIILDAEVK